MKRLNIVVPFRAREAHLKKFVPSIRTYFARDKIDRDIPYRVLIIEQDNGLPFNRGAMKNIGFMLGRDESDYTCFHDVDYLPVWADYSWPEVPSAIVWYGAERRPAAPGRSNGMIYENLDALFGCVLLVPNALFTQVNGYANSYWGWGYEDTDLRNRFKSVGIDVGRRRGTFSSLEHDNEGYELDGTLTAISRINEQIFESRWSKESNSQMQDDGLTNLAYEILDRRVIPEGPTVERQACWEIVTVRLRMQPRREHLEAIADKNEARALSDVFDNDRISRNSLCPCGSGKKFKHCHGALPR